MKIILLTHSREIDKKSNTGSLVVEVLGASAEVIVWERTQPSQVLLDWIDRGRTALLYPSVDSTVISAVGEFECYVVIDGTWQEAKKIYNRSPYLQRLPAVRVEGDSVSAYSLRRNQKVGGLCTAECVIEVLKVNRMQKESAALKNAFDGFLTAAKD